MDSSPGREVRPGSGRHQTHPNASRILLRLNVERLECLTLGDERRARLVRAERSQHGEGEYRCEAELLSIHGLDARSAAGALTSVLGRRCSPAGMNQPGEITRLNVGNAP